MTQVAINKWLHELVRERNGVPVRDWLIRLRKSTSARMLTCGRVIRTAAYRVSASQAMLWLHVIAVAKSEEALCALAMLGTISGVPTHSHA